MWEETVDYKAVKKTNKQIKHPFEFANVFYFQQNEEPTEDTV